MADYQKATTSIGIGVSSATAILAAVEYAGDRLIGSGPGGDLLSLLTVPNTVTPVGIVGHHNWWEIVVGLNEDEYTALYNTSVSGSLKAVVQGGENSPIGYFVITQKSAAGTTRTVTYQSAKTYVANVGMSKVTNEEGKYIVEVRFVCIGTRTVSAWG